MIKNQKKFLNSFSPTSCFRSIHQSCGGAFYKLGRWCRKWCRRWFLTTWTSPAQHNFVQTCLVKTSEILPAHCLQQCLISMNKPLELIKPKLKNWDAERIAALDLIILQMGICEFLYFETIPNQRLPSMNTSTWPRLTARPRAGSLWTVLLDNIHKGTVGCQPHWKNFKNSIL